MAITHSASTIKRFEKECKELYDEAMFRADYKRAQEIKAYYEERIYTMSADPYDSNSYGQGLLKSQQEMLKQQLEAQKMQMMNSVLSSGFTGINSIGAQNATGIANTGILTQNTQVKMNFQPELGVLYLSNKPLPEDWAGAKITEFQRRVNDKNWHVMFQSKWDKALEIHLYLDIEEYNGKEINEMARVYMESLNQRRAG